MDEANIVTARYEVPTYMLQPEERWFHFLYGNVPGHQIDYMYRPEVPQEPLTRQQFSHVTRIVKLIEPRREAAFAFAIANMSRDDTQYEPGHGGVAFVFGLRIKGARDHAGRDNPPFCHAAAVIDRHLDAEAFYYITMQFYQKLLPDEESRVEGSGWYHSYVRYAQTPEHTVPVIRSYLEDFNDLWFPPRSSLFFRWTADPNETPDRVVIVYPDGVDMATLAHCMAKIAAVLVESDIKWSAISNGREPDLTGGMTVRFVPRAEAVTESDDVVLANLEDVPDDPAEIARMLFNAQTVRMSYLPQVRVNLPYTQPQRAPTNGAAKTNDVAPAREINAVRPITGSNGAPTAPTTSEEKPVTNAADIGGISVVQGPSMMDAMLPQHDFAAELKKKQRRNQSTSIIALVLLVVTLGILGVIWTVSNVRPEPPTEPSVVNTAAPVKTTTAAATTIAPTPTPTPTPTPMPILTITSTAATTPPGTSKTKGTSKKKGTNVDEILKQF